MVIEITYQQENKTNDQRKINETHLLDNNDLIA